MFSMDAAADPAMAYRGMSLGDSFQSVLEKASSEFEVAKPRIKRGNTDNATIDAGDKLGAQAQGCNYGTPADRQKRCLATRLVFSHAQEGETLQRIFVEQSLSPAVALEHVVDTLTKAYGKARLSTVKDIAASYYGPASKGLLLVWGGKKTPQTLLYDAPYSHEYGESIGGSFILADIRHKDGMVNGYALTVIDSEGLKATGSLQMKLIRQAHEQGKKESAAAVKF